MKNVLISIAIVLSACGVDAATTTEPDPVRCQIGSPGCPGGGTGDDMAAASATTANPYLSSHSYPTVSRSSFACFHEGNPEGWCSASVPVLGGVVDIVCTYTTWPDTVDVTCAYNFTPARTSGHIQDATTCASDPIITGGRAVSHCPSPDPYAGLRAATVQRAQDAYQGASIGARCQIGAPGCGAPPPVTDPITAAVIAGNPPVHQLDPSASVTAHDVTCAGGLSGDCWANINTAAGNIVLQCTWVTHNDGSVSAECNAFWGEVLSVRTHPIGDINTTTPPDPVRCQIGNPNCPGSPPSDSDYINAANQLSIQTAIATGDGSSGTITDKTTCTVNGDGESKTCLTHVVLDTFWIFELSCDIACVNPPWPPACSGRCGITTAIPPAMAAAGEPVAGARCQIGDPTCGGGSTGTDLATLAAGEIDPEVHDLYPPAPTITGHYFVCNHTVCYGSITTPIGDISFSCDVFINSDEQYDVRNCISFWGGIR